MVRRSEESICSVENMLCCIIGRITKEGLRIDNQPRLTTRSQYVACMQVGREQNPHSRGARQTMRQLDPFANQSWVVGVCNAALGLCTPMGQHSFQRPKRVRSGWATPHPA